MQTGFQISHILTDPRRQWQAIRKAAQGNVRTAFRALDVDWKKYTTDEYLFTHDTACCSVATEENGYWIKPACWELVNANGNAWTNTVLLGSYKTFVGGDNFLEHMQLPSLSKGKILDAIIRPVHHHSEKQNADADIYYVDVLVATNRKHAALVEKIESGKLSTLSMGTICNGTTCSICGKKIYDGDKNCEHLDRHLGKMVKCSDGKERICAELCGCVNNDGSYEEGTNSFIELSWVQHPAFEGAVLNSFIETPAVKKAREQDHDELSKLFESNLFERLKVADVESRVALRITNDETRMDRIADRIFGD